ncbi:MAG TPA: DNA polymerase/3'-5' exonuclease PolX [bacterium]|nr:DNA polymerase/3'-5' exonuclease PolX [bacterium]
MHRGPPGSVGEKNRVTNKAIARIFYDIADILEIRGENLFRAMAYRNAGRSIELSAEDAGVLYRYGGRRALETIPGVGPTIASMIEQLVTTGHLKYYNRIARKIPPVARALTRIPNIGPKTAMELYRALAVSSIEDLERVIDTPIAAVQVREKIRQRIKAGIALLRRRSGQIPLPVAEPIARDLVEALRECPGVVSADPVGSLRRMRETVGDIDIVCATRDPEQAIGRFVSHPRAKQVLGAGVTKAAIIHADGVRVDLEIVPAEQYGSRLQHFTGSEEHNARLRTWAMERGFSISEYGIEKDDRLHTFAHEEDVYKFLGMDWIPPELRENQGEIEAALRHGLPDLVEERDIRGDLQSHSTWSDGHDQIDAVVRAAIDRGYEYLAITDRTKGVGITRGLDAARVAERHNEIAAAKRRYEGRIQLLEGVEVDIRADGHLALPDEILRTMDIVVASIHSAVAETTQRITRRLVAAIDHPYVDVIGHPSGRLLGEREAYPAGWDEVFAAAARRRVALEINASPNRLDLNDTLAREAGRRGVDLAINTAAHKVEHLAMMRYGVAVARRAWLTPAHVVNTRPWTRFSTWLYERKAFAREIRLTAA